MYKDLIGLASLFPKEEGCQGRTQEGLGSSLFHELLFVAVGFCVCFFFLAGRGSGSFFLRLG